MKTTTHFMLLCERAFVTAASNNLVNIFSALNAVTFPFNFPRFSLVMNFDIDEKGDHELETRITAPDSALLASTRMPLRAMEENMQVVANFENLLFSGPGTYRLQALLDGQPLGLCTLKVNAVVRSAEKEANLA